MAAPDGREAEGRRSQSDRTVTVVVLAVLVAVWATFFGFAYAPAAHGREETEAQPAAPANNEFNFLQEGRDEAEALHAEEHQDTDGAGAGLIVSSILLSLAGAGLVPLGLRPSAVVGARSTLVALLSIEAAVIHFAVVAQHFDEWWLTGTFFVLVALFQLAWALLVLRAPSRPFYLAGAVTNALVVVLWIVSRTNGVPVGPGAGEAEPVALPDTLATAFEVVLVVVLVALLSGQTAPGTSRLVRRSAVSWAGAVVVAALTALALVTIA